MTCCRYLRIGVALCLALAAVCAPASAAAQSGSSAPPISVPEARLPPPTERDLVSGRTQRHSFSLRQDIAPGTIPRITLPPLDTEGLRQQRRERELQQEPTPAGKPSDASRSRDNHRPRRMEVGVVRPFRISAADGQWLPLADGSRLWVLDVTSPGAVAVKVHFTNFLLPRGMTLQVSSPGQTADPEEFRSRGPFANGDFWTTAVTGDTARLALVDETGSPADSDVTAIFSVTGVGHIYEDMRGLLYFGTPGACELDAACYPDWSGSGDSVARILFNDADYYYACSATLVNNASGDFSPLLLTASHCIDSDALAQTMTAYFFYKSGSCNGTANENAAYTSSYATLLAATPVDSSDTSLLQILRALPTPGVWAAWTTMDPDFSETLTGIHHPLASYRRIAFGGRITDESAARYDVNWNLGITEPGSSGSPLFNANHEIVGQLHGGVSTCGVSGPDDYGKLNAAYALLVGNDGRNYLEQGLPDDNLANNSRSQAYVINLPASLSNLFVKKLADDWFKVSLPANQGFAADIPFVPNSPPRIEIYRGSETVAISSGDNHAEAGAGNSPTDFFIRIFLPPDPYYSAVRSSYSISFTSKQVAPAGTPTVRTDSADTTHNSANLNGYYFQTGTPVLTSWFLWGTDPTLSTNAETPHVSSSYIYPLAQLTGLLPATQYYFRLAVDWPGGPIYGAILPFQTKAIGTSHFDPAPGEINVLTPATILHWSGYGASYDVYFGTAQDPPYVGNVPVQNNGGNQLFSTGFFDFKPSTTYYWRLVAKYGAMSASSPLLTFQTQNVLTPTPLGNVYQTVSVMTFPSVSVAKNSSEQGIVLISQEAVHVTGVATTGEFTQRNNCVGALVDRTVTTCTIYVTFRPTALGQRVGTLVVTNDAYSLPLAVQLSGTGTELVMVLDRPARPLRPAGSSPTASFEVPLSLASSTNSTCSVSSSLATCTVLRLKSSALITIVPVPRVPSRRKTTGRRARATLKNGRYVVSITDADGKSRVDIPIELR